MGSLVHKKRWGITLVEVMLAIAIIGSLVSAVLITLNIFTGLQSTDTIAKVKREVNQTARDIGRSVRNASYLKLDSGVLTVYQYPTDVYRLKDEPLKRELFDDPVSVAQPSPSPSGAIMAANWGKKTWEIKQDPSSGKHYLNEETEWFYTVPGRREELVTTKEHLKGYLVPPGPDSYIFRKTTDRKVDTLLKVKAFGRQFELAFSDFQRSEPIQDPEP